MIATEGGGEKLEKLNLKICLAGELNPGVKGKTAYQYTKEDC